MSRLGIEFGITGNGLAKICDRLEVPYPPRGYWAKKEAGKRVVVARLPARGEGVPESIEIRPTPPKAAPVVFAEACIQAATAAVGKIAVPEILEDLHPKVKAWIAEHKRDQKERELENKKRGRETFLWGRPLLDDLTERDLYRFRVTSAIFKGVEKAQGKIDAAAISGRVTFAVRGHKLECSIVEKMLKPLKRPEGEAAKWTAYPGHHQSGLQSSGFLRVTITTYLSGKQPQWIETANKRIADWLPEIVSTIIGAGPILVEQQREREESTRRYLEEEARRNERRRAKEIDERRWAQFRQRAADWEERARLLAFVAELQKRLEVEGDVKAGEHQLSEWIAWAQEKIDGLDPFKEGLLGIVESIAN